MESFGQMQSSRRLLSAVLRTNYNTSLQTHISSVSKSRLLRIPRSPRRNASSSSTDNSRSQKTTVLEQPDKFRPPSHPQRLVRSRPRTSGYNQGVTDVEREVQKTKRYPHTFPNPGTGMHWFLTNRRIHMYITLGTLSLLAVFSLTQSFIHTSPYSHLLPPISSLPFHPITYIKEAASVFRLHMEYTTEQTAESRKQNILDAQKRRLYRRANGMEDLNAEEDQGVDVRGLVPWDDGLTNTERAQGGRYVRTTGRMVVEMGGEAGEDIDEFMKKKKAEAEMRERGIEPSADAIGQSSDEQQHQPPRKRKLFFGIW